LIASGLFQMREDLGDDLGRLDARDDRKLPTAAGTAIERVGFAHYADEFDVQPQTPPVVGTAAVTPATANVPKMLRVWLP
jgi:hypothetical protein